jgi:hypothetical protein
MGSAISSQFSSPPEYRGQSTLSVAAADAGVIDQRSHSSAGLGPCATELAGPELASFFLRDLKSNGFCVEGFVCEAGRPAPTSLPVFLILMIGLRSERCALWRMRRGERGNPTAVKRGETLRKRKAWTKVFE